MRDVETIDHDLTLVVRLRSMMSKQGLCPTWTLADRLLDERLVLMRNSARAVSTVR
jgi:hypothetical protein